jgi:hypothetical protein
MAVAAFAVFSSVTIASAQQGSGIQFVAEPASGSQTAPEGGYFLLSARPGRQIVQTLALRNDSGEPLELRIDAVDATTGPYGGASYSLENESPSETGTWIKLRQSSVTLAPGESDVVEFEVAVPADATSGEHLAGISVWSPAPSSGTKDAQAGQAGAAIHVQTRRIVAVQVNLPGSSQPELVISGIEPATRPDGLYLEIKIENAGRGLTTGEGLIQIPSESFEQSFNVDTFVPGTTIGYPIRWAESAAEGEYGARVEINYEGEIATWEGTFTIGQEQSQQLAERGIGTSQSSIGSWWIIALAFVAIASAGFLMLRRRGNAKVLPSSGQSVSPSWNTPARATRPSTRPAKRTGPPPPPPPALKPPPPPSPPANQHSSRGR